MSGLYLEAHVTISPVIEETARAFIKDLVKPYGFKLAYLVMLKGNSAEPSKRDTFMTGHGKDIDDLAERTRAVVMTLDAHGFRVWRYKIESCVIDSRQQGDIWGVLDPNRPELPLIACESCTSSSSVSELANSAKL